ncbi:MAG: hypothetical protein GX299_08230 [Epulopiscium sp.]|jgi:hypothetical protein|nr:hypothetical protein [Candidatus Epulonipiscium sp.]
MRDDNEQTPQALSEWNNRVKRKANVEYKKTTGKQPIAQSGNLLFKKSF